MAEKKTAGSKPGAPEKAGRLKQIRQSYTMTKQTDPKIGLVLLGTFLVVAIAATALAYLLFRPSVVFPIVFGILGGVLGALIVFGRRAQSSAMHQLEGRPGAAAAVLGMLRRGWKTDAAIGVTRQQDIVHRVVGPPGIVLVGEGNPNRLKPLLTSERRRHERVATDVPIHEVVVGDDEGQVPLRLLVKHVTKKLGKDLKPAQMTDVLQRLKALDAHRQAVPMPKGPVPTSMKGMRGQARQNQRGR